MARPVADAVGTGTPPRLARRPAGVQQAPIERRPVLEELPRFLPPNWARVEDTRGLHTDRIFISRTGIGDPTHPFATPPRTERPLRRLSPCGGHGGPTLRRS